MGARRVGAAFGGLFRLSLAPFSAEGAACANWTGPDCTGAAISDESVKADVASRTRRKCVMTIFSNKDFGDRAKPAASGEEPINR